MFINNWSLMLPFNSAPYIAESWTYLFQNKSMFYFEIYNTRIQYALSNINISNTMPFFIILLCMYGHFPPDIISFQHRHWNICQLRFHFPFYLELCRCMFYESVEYTSIPFKNYVSRFTLISVVAMKSKIWERNILRNYSRMPIVMYSLCVLFVCV